MLQFFCAGLFEIHNGRTPEVKGPFNYVSIMRRSNYSAPIPPGQPRGQRKYACDKKGRGTRKKGDYIGRGKYKLR